MRSTVVRWCFDSQVEGKQGYERSLQKYSFFNLRLEDLTKSENTSALILSNG